MGERQGSIPAESSTAGPLERTEALALGLDRVPSRGEDQEETGAECSVQLTAGDACIAVVRAGVGAIG